MIDAILVIKTISFYVFLLHRIFERYRVLKKYLTLMYIFFFFYTPSFVTYTVYHLMILRIPYCFLIYFGKYFYLFFSFFWEI